MKLEERLCSSEPMSQLRADGAELKFEPRIQSQRGQAALIVLAEEKLEMDDGEGVIPENRAFPTEKMM